MLLRPNVSFPGTSNFNNFATNSQEQEIQSTMSNSQGQMSGTPSSVGMQRANGLALEQQHRHQSASNPSAAGGLDLLNPNLYPYPPPGTFMFGGPSHHAATAAMMQQQQQHQQRHLHALLQQNVESFHQEAIRRMMSASSANSPGLPSAGYFGNMLPPHILHARAAAAASMMSAATTSFPAGSNAHLQQHLQPQLEQHQKQRPFVPLQNGPASGGSAVGSFSSSSKSAWMPIVPNSINDRKRVASSDEDTASASSLSDGNPNGVVGKDVRSPKREKIDGKTFAYPEENSEMGLGGESRLKISFASLGSPGKYPQVFGKSRLGVPDGLSGTYVLYSERWTSEIVHGQDSFEGEDGTKHVLITWKITNLTSGITQSRTETPKEAILRHKDGRTLCNKVFRRALEQRATELEDELRTETNPIRVKTMRNLVKKLRPKHFSEGPLVFGLRHECVQSRFRSMTMLDSSGMLVTKSTPAANS